MKRFVDPERLMPVADWLVVGIALMLPWSTSATGILICLWLIAVLGALDCREAGRMVMTPAGGLPVLLVLLGLAGMLWADASLKERLHSFGEFSKLLVLPLLFLHFRRSDKGMRVLAAYFASCTILLFASWVETALSTAAWGTLPAHGVPVKNEATQSEEFALCIFFLLFFAIDQFQRGSWRLALGAFLLTLPFLGNIFFVATGRTALVIMAVLLALLIFKKLTVKLAPIAIIVTALIAVVAWNSSEYLRNRAVSALANLHPKGTVSDVNPSTERVEFARKSIEFISQAPVAGHGTGTIAELFRRAAAGQIGLAARATANPHNQTLAVAIQLGLIGAIVLWAMWITHMLFFRGSGLVEWIGLIVVVQNIVGSLFNSHLFDFVQGWTYVFGVGVAGGELLRLRSRTPEKNSGTASMP